MKQHMGTDIIFKIIFTIELQTVYSQVHHCNTHKTLSLNWQ